MLSDLLSKILKAKQPEGAQPQSQQDHQVKQSNLYQPSIQAQRWLNQCNFTNLQQKLQFVQNDPQWGPQGYQQLLALDPMLLENYQLPRSQLDKNISTYMEMLTSALNNNIDVECQQILRAMTRSSNSQKEEIDPHLLAFFGNLKNVLLAYSKYDPSIQQPSVPFGCLATSILQNCQGDEVSTFWILISLVENYEMRSFHQKGLPGVALYGEVLHHLIEVHLPAVSYIFKQFHIEYFDYFDHWVKELFARQMPPNLQALFIGSFLKDSWPYFYRVCLSLIQSLQGQIVNMTEQSKSKKLVQTSILRILNFQIPQPQLVQQPRASENFKNLNERGSPAQSSGSDENFTNSSDDEKSDQKSQQLRVTNIKVNRQKLPDEKNNPGLIGTFLNYFKPEEAPVQNTTQGKASLKKLKIQDYIDKPDESWKYVLEIANQQWVSHEGQGTQIQYERQLIDIVFVNDLLNSMYNIALKKFLEFQQKQMEIERNEIMARFPAKQIKNLGDPDPNFNNKERNSYPLEQDLGSVIQFDALQASKIAGISHRGSYNRNYQTGFGAFQGQKSFMAQNSQLGLTLNLDFLKNDKSNIQTKENLNNIFNDGDVSMLREVDQLFQIYTSRQHKESIKKVEKPPAEDDDGFLNTSRYQGTENMGQQPHKLIADQQNIGNISEIGIKEDFGNLESDRNLFMDLGLQTKRQFYPDMNQQQLGVVQEEPSRMEITPMRGKLPPKPSKSINKYAYNQDPHRQSVDTVNQTLIVSNFTSPKANDRRIGNRNNLLSPQPENNKLGIQSSVPKPQIRKKNYFEQQLTPNIPPVTPMKLLSSCQDENSIRLRNKQSQNGSNSMNHNTGDDGSKYRDQTPEQSEASRYNKDGATPQPQRPMANNEIRIGSFDYYQKGSNYDGSEKQGPNFSQGIQNYKNRGEESDFIMPFDQGIRNSEPQNLKRTYQESPVISVERESYNHMIRNQDCQSGYDRFGNKISNTSLGISSQMRLNIPQLQHKEESIRITTITSNRRPLSPAILSPSDQRQMYISSKQDSINQKMKRIQDLQDKQRNKMASPQQKQQEKVRINQTGHSSTGIATNNKSNTRVSKEQMNSSSNNSKYLNQSNMPVRLMVDMIDEQSIQHSRKRSPQGLMIKQQQSADMTKSRKKLQSAPRGSRQGWKEQVDPFPPDDKQQKKIAVQNFIDNAKKNKFSEWRKSKMGMSDFSEGDQDN